MNREGPLIRSILHYLAMLPVDERGRRTIAWRNNNQPLYDVKHGCFRTSAFRPGISDIIGCHRGRFLAIEVKAGKTRVTDAQREFIDLVNANGGIGMIVRSLDEIVSAFPI